MSPNSGFLVKLVVFSAAVLVILYASSMFLLPPALIYGKWYVLQVFMMVVTAFFHYGLTRAGEKGPQHFVRFFMGATAAKLFVFMIIIIGYGLFNKDTAVPFIIHFFILYLFYSVFEVSQAYKKFGAPRESGSR